MKQRYLPPILKVVMFEMEKGFATSNTTWSVSHHQGFVGELLGNELFFDDQNQGSESFFGERGGGTEGFFGNAGGGAEGFIE